MSATPPPTLDRDNPPPDSVLLPDPQTPLPALALRGAIGGLLMGLANLVPGISGGTMLLAAGVYTHFIEAISEITAFRVRLRPLVILIAVVITAALAILLFARPVHYLVTEHRWVMYSLFIGLTLGGVPVVWRLIGIATPGVAGGAVVGFFVMVVIAVIQQRGTSGSSGDPGFLLLLLAGIAGASAMILPGISGGYLLLVLGVYVPILGAISAFKDALGARDLEALWQPMMQVMLPVGIGVVAGVVAVSHVLRLLLRQYENTTLGVLLGLLLGSIVGLYPFLDYVEPAPGQLIKNQAVTQIDGQWYYEQSLRPVKHEDFPTRTFRPGLRQSLGALGLVAAGFVVTFGVAQLSAYKPKRA